MAASLLMAVGMPDCITSSLSNYVVKAIQIGRDKALHGKMKAHLAGDAWARTLGDSAGFTRRFETVMKGVRRQKIAD